MRAIRELPSVHPGQDDIGQKEIDFLLPDPKLQGNFSISRFNHVISKLAQRIRNEFANVAVILNQQDDFRTIALWGDPHAQAR